MQRCSLKRRHRRNNHEEQNKGIIAAVVVFLLVALIVAVQSVFACRCTPGWWKNRAGSDEWAWAGYSPDDPVTGVFVVPEELYAADGNKWSVNDTLLDALSYRGGKGDAGGARILLRAGVAVLLNEASFYRGPGDNQLPSPWPPDGVIGLVNTALALDRDTMIERARVLDDWNNERCLEICEDWPNCPFEE